MRCIFKCRLGSKKVAERKFPFSLLHLPFFILLFLIINLVLHHSCASQEEEDKIPPGIVRDLRVSYTDFFGFEIEFTAPGDDLFSGTANRFDIRYSTSEDFFKSPERNFEILGIQVPEAPVPPPAGQKVRFFIRNLDPKTRYFVALRTYDEVGNFSNVSNVVEVITKDVPGSSGEFIGRVKLPSYFQKIVADNENIYLLFPGIYKIEKVGKLYKISPVNTSVPYIIGSQVVWDGEKFVSIGGNINGVLVSSALGIYPEEGKPPVPLINEGDVVPFGVNGYFGYGIMQHKIAKFGSDFVVLGGIKYLLPRIDLAEAQKKFARISTEKVILFRTSGTKITWKILYPESVTSPISIVNPAVIPFDDGEVLLWGGSRSESLISPERDMFVLKNIGGSGSAGEDEKRKTTAEGSEGGDKKPASLYRKEADPKLAWYSYVPFSGKLYEVINSCEAEGEVKILRVRETEVEEETKFSSPEDANPGDIISVDDKVYEVIEVDVVRKFFVVGRFRYENSEFPAILSFFPVEGKGVIVRLKPKFGVGQWNPPDLSFPCSALYFKNTLFILYLDNLYILGYKGYEIHVVE